jgi:hypothetical protein
MKRYIKQILSGGTLSILVACAGTPEGEGGDAYEDEARRNDCIHEPSIRGYSALDDMNLLVDAAGRRSYHVILMRRAYGLRDSWAIGFRSPTSRICERFSDVVFEGNFGGESIRIKTIRELAPEEKEALLIRFGKKEPEVRPTPAPEEVKGADVEELDADDDE